MPARKIDLDELARLHEAGWHRDELAAHFDVAPANITRARRSLGLPLDPPRRSPRACPPRKVDRDEFARLDAQGWTIPRLAAHFEVDPVTVCRIRKELGVARPVAVDQAALARAAELLADGASYAETRRTTGLDRETLRRHFPGQGWTQAEVNAWVSDTRRLHKTIRQDWRLRGQRAALRLSS